MRQINASLLYLDYSPYHMVIIRSYIALLRTLKPMRALNIRWWDALSACTHLDYLFIFKV